MSFYVRKVFLLISLCWFVASAIVDAQTWMRGSVAILSVTGEVTVQESGGALQQWHAADPLPQYASGLVQIRTELDDAVFLETSNQIFIYHQGAGSFVIERFEQEIESATTAGKSRMILNFRHGVLMVDNRALSAGSKMIVETPIGRISVNNGWWLMKLSYDEHHQMYYFSIECADGVLYLHALNDISYIISPKQRLSGAGLSSNPSIEASNISDAGHALFNRFAASVADSAPSKLPSDAFRAKMKPIEYVASPVSVNSEVSTTGRSTRPLLIEYAPRPAPVTPFRAVIRPPSDQEADLF